MAHQSLDHEEVLNVRWATADPNPMARAREARRVEEQAAAAIRAALPPEYVAELEGRDPEASKRRKIEGSFGLDGYEAPDDVWFSGRRDTAGHDPSMSEAVPPTRLALEPESSPEGAKGEETAGGGILSSSTLAALNGAAVKFSAANETKPAGMLVDYSSDDDGD